MLFNATQSEEMRVAIVRNHYLENAFIEHPGNQRKSNIYKGTVTRIEPSLQAAFVDFGSSRHGFLPVKEVAPSYYRDDLSDRQRVSIADALVEGQEVLVQVDKEERGNKGAALTTYISLAGCYIVLMPNNPRAGGISRRIDGDDRDELRNTLDGLNLPDSMGLIVRTAGVGRSQDELQWDLNILLNQWEAIQQAFESTDAPALILQESDMVIRAIRDHLRKDIDEIVIDSPEVFEKAKKHISRVRPEFIDNIKLYQGTLPLFSFYQVENQIETAFQSEVRLPSGGSVVIQGTEALVSIDVNSAQDTKGGNIEQTALNTNKEAAKEIARQLRLRDIGGLIVVDFIDMISSDSQRDVVNTFQQHVSIDKARVQWGRISRFGLLEISRQRLRPSLMDATQVVCPRCSGEGTIRSTESLALFILRIIREDALQSNISEIQAQLPVSVATYIVNEKRHATMEIEKTNDVIVRIIPNPELETPQYKIIRVRDKQGSGQPTSASYQLKYSPETEDTSYRRVHAVSDIEPAVKDIDVPIKPDIKSSKGGFVSRLLKLFSGSEEEEKVEQPKQRHQRHRSRSRQDSRRRDSRGGDQRQRRNRNQQRHRRGKDNRGRDGNESSSQRRDSGNRRDNRRNDNRNDSRRNDNRRGNQRQRTDNRRRHPDHSRETERTDQQYQAPKPQQQELKHEQPKPQQDNNKPVENRVQPAPVTSAPAPSQPSAHQQTAPQQPSTPAQAAPVSQPAPVNPVRREPLSNQVETTASVDKPSTHLNIVKKDLPMTTEAPKVPVKKDDKPLQMVETKNHDNADS
ncbi:MAG: ribonuclease E [Legionellales bacterium]|nr:ribonuclease E [Legionellales bacterium]|tara:strand:- start:10790 stop:13189 length:2400 start_codon:yes stop_codon:yes gene_type:complete